MKYLALVVLAAAAAVVAALWQWSPQAPPPTDAAMIENLRAKRAIFDELIAMIVYDRGLERVDVDWTRPDDPAAINVPPARIAAYRKLLTEAGAPRGFYAFEPRTAIEFIAYASGMVVHGMAKSYVYILPGAESTRYKFEMEDGDLDAAALGQRKFYRHRHIEGNWYLHLERS